MPGILYGIRVPAISALNIEMIEMIDTSLIVPKDTEPKNKYSQQMFLHGYIVPFERMTIWSSVFFTR